jgi:hypothetical protein
VLVEGRHSGVILLFRSGERKRLRFVRNADRTGGTPYSTIV